MNWLRRWRQRRRVKAEWRLMGRKHPGNWYRPYP